MFCIYRICLQFTQNILCYLDSEPLDRENVSNKLCPYIKREHPSNAAKRLAFPSPTHQYSL